MIERKVTGYIDGSGGTLKATLNGHPATFEVGYKIFKWTCPDNPKLEAFLNKYAASYRSMTIDRTAESVFQILRPDITCTINSFEREQIPIYDSLPKVCEPSC